MQLPHTEKCLLLCEANRTERQIKTFFCFYKHTAPKIPPGINYLATIHSYLFPSLSSSLTPFLTHSSNNSLSIPIHPSIHPHLLSIVYVPINVSKCISKGKQNDFCSHKMSRLWGVTYQSHNWTDV